VAKGMAAVAEVVMVLARATAEAATVTVAGKVGV